MPNIPLSTHDPETGERICMEIWSPERHMRNIMGRLYCQCHCKTCRKTHPSGSWDCTCVMCECFKPYHTDPEDKSLVDE